MESFTVQCTSCESRIRVRNPNMIGQIANCPKCGSMILIAAPDKITVESGNVTDSVAVTREALPPPEQSLLNSQSAFETGFRIEGLPSSANSAASADQPIDDEYRLAADPIFDQSAPGEPESESSSGALPLGAWLPGPTSDDVAPPPRAGADDRATDIDASIQAVRAKRQESAAKSRQVMLVATIGLCSVLVAVGILVMFLRWISKPNVVAQNQPVVKQPVKPDVDAGTNPDASVQAVANEPSSLPGDAANPNGASTPNIDVPYNNSTAASPSNVATPTTPTDPVTSVPTGPTPAGPTTIGNASETKKPLGGSIAPSLDAVLGPATVAEQPKSDAPLELPPGLQGFSRMFEQSFDPVLSDASVPLEKATELPDDVDNKPKNPDNAASAAPAVDLVPAIVDKMLSAQLLGIDIDRRPLSEALTTLSLVGEVPIVADIDALQVIGATKNTLVKVRVASATSFDEVLKSITASTKISLVPMENRVIFARASDEDLERVVPATLPIADLVSDAGQRNQLVQALKEVLPELGDTIQVSEAGVQLELSKANRLTWYQAARLLETWRVARGIKNDASSAVVPKSSLLPAWPVDEMQSVSKTVLKQVVPSEPIARSWQRLTAEARVACWVDWYGLQMNETNPRQKSTVIASGRTLGDVLQHYANKYQVVFAIDDARALWATSPDMHRLQSRLYVLPLGEKTLDQWTAELESLAPVNPTNGASLLRLIPTPDGQFLFVRCCRPILVEPNL